MPCRFGAPAPSKWHGETEAPGVKKEGEKEEKKIIEIMNYSFLIIGHVWACLCSLHDNSNRVCDDEVRGTTTYKTIKIRIFHITTNTILSIEKECCVLLWYMIIIMLRVSLHNGTYPWHSHRRCCRCDTCQRWSGVSFFFASNMSFSVVNLYAFCLMFHINNIYDRAESQEACL